MIIYRIENENGEGVYCNNEIKLKYPYHLDIEQSHILTDGT